MPSPAPAVDTPRQDAAAAPPAKVSDEAAGKVRLPVTVSLAAADGAPLRPDAKTTLELSVTPDVEVARGSVRVAVSDDSVVELLTPPEFELGSIASGVTSDVAIHVRLAGPGKSEVRAWVTASDAEGQSLFEVSHALYVVVTSTAVFTSDRGFVEPELAALDHARASGEIDDAQYQERKHAITAGGAMQQITLEYGGDGNK
ncbi:MAG TPA: SHOCT domain-containing protein [Candidatus Hydrogenedentes bacterium]|nr:SHOCT domain-containing protein [Candidatus Hydrogenedentota bacterium]HPG69635.1 SHOCT domain-containing protein [Candidatus Hydrogenedentota bacterium]